MQQPCTDEQDRSNQQRSERQVPVEAILVPEAVEAPEYFLVAADIRAVADMQKQFLAIGVDSVSSRPLLNSVALPTAATNAVAVSGPTPSTAATRRQR